MPPDQLEESSTDVRTSLIRLEAKIDVVLGRHEARLEDHARRLGEISSTLHEHDTRITANALTTAETRNSLIGAERDIAEAKTDLVRRIEDGKPRNVAQWVMIAVAAVAIVLSPILTDLLLHAH